MIGSKILQQKIDYWAKNQGEKQAIVETTLGVSITYQELRTSIFSLKTYFGKRPKTILVAIPNSIFDALIWLTALTQGHVLIPVSPFLTDYEYKEIITHHKPDIIIADNKDIFKGNIPVVTPSEVLARMKTHLADTSAFVQEGKVYLSTSGSTSKPKGVVLSATQLVLTAHHIIKSHRLTKTDSGLTPLPFYHVNAPVVSLITTILTESTLLLAPKYSTTHFWEWVEKYHPTWISLVPTMIAMLLNTQKPQTLDTSHIRFVRTASAPLPVENLKRFEKKFYIPIIETYGITEAGSTIAANPPPPHIHKPGSVGLPIGVCITIRDPQTQENLPQGKVGEVWVKGSNVITQYENKKSPESFVDTYFRTGDLGYTDSQGYLYLTGRIKDIIIRGGENISPREIEEVLVMYPGVEEAVVVGQPDEIYGELPVAFVVLQSKATEKTAEKIKDYAKSKLSVPKVPVKVYILSNFPRGKTGKIDRKPLKNPQQNGIFIVAMR